MVVWKENRDTLLSLMPGRLVNVVPQGYAKNGVLVSFADFQGAIEVGHLGLNWDALDEPDGVRDWKKVWEEQIPMNKLIKARIILIDPTTKILRLSLLPHILNMTTPPPLTLSVGSIHTYAKVLQHDYKIGSVLLPNDSSNCPIYLPHRNVGKDVKLPEYNKRYKRGKVIDEIRITSTTKFYFENYAEGSTDPEVLSASVLSYDNLRPGTNYKATIISTGDDTYKYILVQLGVGVKGIVPGNRIFDSGAVISAYKRGHLRKMYKVDGVVNVRVVESDSVERKCTCSLQPSFLKDEDATVSYDLKTNRIVTGAISKIHEEKGFIISFYNNVHGYVTRKRLRRDGISVAEYALGQVVQCRVVRARVASEDGLKKGTLELSLDLTATDDNDEGDDVEIESGIVLPPSSLKITSLEDDADGKQRQEMVIVSFKRKLVDGKSGKLSGRVPRHELMTLGQKLVVGKKIDAKAMILTSTISRRIPYFRLTINPTIVKTSPLSLIPASRTTLYNGAKVVGLVSHVDERFGAFVNFRDGLQGFVPKKYPVEANAVVTAQVISLDGVNDDKGNDNERRRSKIVIKPLKMLQVGDENLVARVVRSKSDMFVSLKVLDVLQESDKTKARLHVSQLKDNATLSDFKVGDLVKDLTCTSLEQRHGRTYVELSQLQHKDVSAKTASLSSKDGHVNDLKKGEIVSARVTRLAKEGLYVSIAPGLVGCIPHLEISSNMKVLNNLSKHYPPGTFISGRVISMPRTNRARISLLDCKGTAPTTPPEYNAGDVVIGMVSHRSGNLLEGINPPALLLEMRGGVRGRCCITELRDVEDWVNMPLGRDDHGNDKNDTEKQEEKEQPGEKDVKMDEALSDDDNDKNEEEEDETEEGNDKEEDEKDEDASVQGLYYPPGSFHKMRILEKLEVGKNYRYHVSLRPSRIKDHERKSSKSKGIDIENDPAPEPKDICKAYVVNTTKKGCFVRLSRNVHGKCLVKDLTDFYLPDPSKTFRRGRLVMGKVQTVTKTSSSLVSSPGSESYQVGLVLRESALLSSDKLTLGDVKEGDKHAGVVTRVEPYGVFITLDNSDVRGMAHVSECSDAGFIKKGLEKLFDPGDLVKCFVLSVDTEKRRLKLSLKASHFEGDSDSDSDSEEDSDSSSEDEMDLEKEDTGLDSDDENYVAKLAKKDAIMADNKSEDDASSSSDSDDDTSSTTSSEPEIPTASTGQQLPSMDADLDFDWSSTPTTTSQGKRRQSRAQDDSDSDSDSSTSSSEKDSSTHHKSRHKNKQKRRQESETLSRENALASGAALTNPETPADFERLIASDPNFSEYYIRYMAYHLSLADVDNARGVGQRALDKIAFREEGEKLNVWTALLTLELKYGDEEDLKRVLEKACRENNPKKVYLRLGEMLESDALGGEDAATPGHVARAENHYVAACKKFRSKKQVWIAHLKFLLRIGKHEEANKLLKRSMKSLPSYKHVETVSKFAQLEYEFGSVERGRTIFDGLLVNYPKRMDLLFVYVDKEVKVADDDAGAKDIGFVRSIFQKVAENKDKRYKFSDKQMKSLFKKWFRIEEAHGDDESKENVKDAARAFVEKSS